MHVVSLAIRLDEPSVPCRDSIVHTVSPQPPRLAMGRAAAAEVSWTAAHATALAAAGDRAAGSPFRCGWSGPVAKKNRRDRRRRPSELRVMDYPGRRRVQVLLPGMDLGREGAMPAMRR